MSLSEPSSPTSPASQATLAEQLLSLSPVATALVEGDTVGSLAYVNTAFTTLTGHAAEATAGQAPRSLLSWPDDSGAWFALEQAIVENRPFQGLVSIRRQDGARVTAEARLRSLPHAAGRPRRFALMLSDVSRTVDLEAALERSEAQHRLLSETIRDVVLVLRTLDSVCVQASTSVRPLLGFEPRDLVGRAFFDFIHPENVLQARKLLAAHVDGRPESLLMHRIRKKDGAYLWVETTFQLRGDGRDRSELVATVRDITRRKETEATLTAMHGLLSSVYEAVPIGLCLLDNRNYVQLCNRAFALLFATEPAELAGRPIGSTLALAEISLASGRPGAIHTFDAFRRDGGQFPAELTVTPVKFTDETWRLLTLSDTTERRRLEARLREARQLESLGTLAGGIAHDFNNILTIVLGYAGLLEEQAHDPAALSRAASAITDASHRGADVVRQLQLFANQHEIEPVRTDLQALIDDTIQRTCADWPQHVQVSSVFGIFDATLDLDATQIALGLRHLLQNACDAMPQGGTVKVRTAEGFMPATHGGDPTQAFVVTIEDSGHGMDDSTRARIFEPFFAKDRGPAVRGLGLAVVYGIMRAHRGQIEVDSAPGQGTRVHLYFPRNQSSAATANSTDSAPTAPPANRAAPRSVLVVEDETDIGSLWENIFAAEGIPLRLARDGEEALRIFAAHRDDIGMVFSDIGLPGIDGWEVAKRIRIEMPHIPLLLVSGAFKPGDRSEAELAPPIVCLPKPFPPSEVLAHVRRFLQIED